jgi:hypothetical protein
MLMPRKRSDFVEDALDEVAPIEPAERIAFQRRCKNLEQRIDRLEKDKAHLLSSLEAVEQAKLAPPAPKLHIPVRLERPSSKHFERWLIISDLQSVFLDPKAFALFLQVLSDNPWDFLLINGDLLDFTTISEHVQKIRTYHPSVLRRHDLEDEFEFTRSQILASIHRIKPRMRVGIRLGNHEMRFINPNRQNASAVSEILESVRYSGKTTLEDILQLEKFNATLSYNGVDQYDKFSAIHGISCAKNAPDVNLRKYGSGTSGHTHRMGVTVEAYHGGRRSWNESGCLRTVTDVEFLPHGEVPNWTQGFLSLMRDKRNPDWFSCTPHPIIKYQAEFAGVRYAA